MTHSNRATLNILSLFPDSVSGILNSSILRRAQVKGLVDLSATDLRHFAKDKHKSVDDAPFGGEQGMLFKPDVLDAACEAELSQVNGHRNLLKVIYLSPRGYLMDQPIFEDLSNWLLPKESASSELGRRICFVCGRYEGVDERWIRRWVDLELSMGDFILTGGELAAMVAVDAIVRLLPGVLGHEKSAKEESFSQGLLEQAQYTRPRNFQGLEVPEALLSGHHKNIEEFKLRQSLLTTFAFRPDLIQKHKGENLPPWALCLLNELKSRIR